jgi:hypothetical protein
MNPHLADLIRDCERVPFLHAYTTDGVTVCLVLDERLGLELPEADACAVIPFIIDCVKVAMQGAPPPASRKRPGE